MRIPSCSGSRRDVDISMTPMIDIVFLLLIFFVCTASFQIVESILPSPLSLPGAADVELPTEPEDAELERILITVAQSEKRTQLAVNGQPCASADQLAQLLNELARIDNNLPVLLDISDDTTLGFAIDVYDRCRLANFQRIQFVAKELE